MGSGSSVPFAMFLKKIVQRFQNRRFDDINFFLQEERLGHEPLGKGLTRALQMVFFPGLKELVLFLGILRLQVFLFVKIKFGFFTYLVQPLPVKFSRSSPSSFFLKSLGNPVRFTAFRRKKDRCFEKCFPYLVQIFWRILQVGSLPMKGPGDIGQFVKTDQTSWSSIPAAFGRELCSLRPTLLVSFVLEVAMDSLGALHFPKLVGLSCF